MSRAARRLSGRSQGQARARLLAHLRERRQEIEQAVLSRAHAIADPSETVDPAHREGLRVAVSAAIDYALEVIERGEERAPSPPPALRAQARLAARSGVALDTVLRRYFAGYSLLGDFLASDAAREAFPDGAVPAQLLQGRAAVFDRLLAAVSEEHKREAQSGPANARERDAERVRSLLRGEPLDTSQLGYDFDCNHVGMISTGPGAAEALRRLAAELDRRLLLVQPDHDALWAWLGSRRPIDSTQLHRSVARVCPEGSQVAIGEPAEGLPGWRLTHRQARAALLIAGRRGDSVVSYSDVALLSAAVSDELLASSLRRRFLAPLEAGPDRGQTARKTLRAYIASAGNVSSAAAALGVKRHTVTHRLRRIEATLERPLLDCMPELHLALCLQVLGESEPGADT